MDLLLDFRDDGFYLLDEPEAALSPNRQLAALSAIDQLVKRGSQFIIATHSPILLAYPNAKILLFDAAGISESPTRTPNTTRSPAIFSTITNAACSNCWATTQDNE